VSENRVLSRIFGSKRKEVAGGWKTLNNEELHNLYISPNTIRVLKSQKWVGNVAFKEEMRNAYKILGRKHEGKRPLEIPRHRCEDNIRMGLLKIWWEGVDWMHLVQDMDQWQAVVNMVMNLWVP
jgi:hypothetical protein